MSETTDGAITDGPVTEGSGTVDRAHCPVDDWAFDPRYTEGVCPLCGWRPPGLAIEPPRFAEIDWFWPAVGAMLLASILMGVLALVAYNSH